MRGEDYNGTAAQTEEVTLQKGAYTVQLVSAAEGAECSLEVYSVRRMNLNNTQGAFLGSIMLQPGNTLTELSFSVEEFMEDICFRLIYGGEGSWNINGLYVHSNQRMYTDVFCLLGAILLISFVIFIWRIHGGKLSGTDRTAFLVLSAAVALASLPLTFDFVLDGNDLYYQFNRILGIQEGLKSGQFPVKIHSGMLHGYGYASSVFYPELFLYLPALLGCVGVSLVNCYKTLVILMNVAAAFISYKSFSGVSGSKETGLVASVLYTLSIYRLIDIYTRAAIGEAIAMIFLPLVLWGMYELFLGNPKRWYLAMLGYTGLIQSHVLSTELTVFFCCIFGLVYIGRLREKGRLASLLLAAGCTVLLNLGSVLPVLHHMQYPFKVFSVNSTLSWWTATLPKLFDMILANPAKRTYAGIQNSGEMPISLGFVLLVGILVFLYGYFREEEKDCSWKQGMFAFLLGTLGIYLSTNLFPWDKVQEMEAIRSLVTTIQIPWRFLALSSALLCLVSAIGFVRFSSEKEVRKLVCAGACVLAFLCAGIYVNRYCEEGAVKYTYVNQYQREKSQVDELYFIDVPHSNAYRIWHRENTFVASEGMEVYAGERSGDLKAGFSYRTSNAGEHWVDVPFTYYPNYKAYQEDGTRLRTDVGEQGVLRVWLPENVKEGTVQIAYEEPWFYMAGRLLSAGCLIGLIVDRSILQKRKKKEQA